jgi:hypothetical protein
MWRKVVLGALLVVLIGGIVTILAVRHSDSGDGEAAGPVASVPAPQTTAVTSPARDEQPPPLLNTGEDWTTIMRSLEAYNDWLARHPNPDLLTNVLHPSNPVFGDSKNALIKFASGEWRYDPVPRPKVVERVVLTSRLGDKTALLFVWSGPTDEYRIVDRTGKVVFDAPAQPASKALVTLVQDDNDPRWVVGKGQAA